MSRRRRPLRIALSLLAAVLVLGAAGVAVRVWERHDAGEWDRHTAEDLRGMHRDLGEAIALLRGSGFEVTGRDVARWLRHLDRGEYLTGGATVMTLLRHDAARGRFLVMAAGTWHDALTETTHAGEACARLHLTDDLANPLRLAEVSCPDGARPPADRVLPTCPGGGCEVDDELLARTVLRVKRARMGTPVSSPVQLSPRPVPRRPVGDLRADSAHLRCAPGTRDVGVRAGYVEGRRLDVRLCAVPGLPSTGEESTPGTGHYVAGARRRAVVNARVSGAALALVQTARRHGIRLKATSSFRTAGHQRELCREDHGCRTGDHTLVAPPGHSQHQLGVAIDFAGTRVTGTQSCARRATDPRSRVWRFLEAEAGRFGFRQYAAESWHWDALPAAGRCDP